MRCDATRSGLTSLSSCLRCSPRRLVDAVAIQRATPCFVLLGVPGGAARSALHAALCTHGCCGGRGRNCGCDRCYGGGARFREACRGARSHHISPVSRIGKAFLNDHTTTTTTTPAASPLRRLPADRAGALLRREGAVGRPSVRADSRSDRFATTPLANSPWVRGPIPRLRPGGSPWAIKEAVKRLRPAERCDRCHPVAVSTPQTSPHRVRSESGGGRKSIGGFVWPHQPGCRMRW